MTQQSVKIGFIGAGGHSTQSIYPSLRFAPIELVAICDLDEEKAKRNARWFGAQRVYTDYREMLEKEALDAVFIVIGPSQHYSIGRECLSRGFHVFVEKPPCNTSTEAQEIAALSAETGKFFMIAFMKRFASGVQMAKKVIGEEEFGSPVLIEGKMASSPYPDEITQLRDHSIHYLDLVRFFMGDVERIYAEQTQASERRFGFAVTLRFKNGGCGVLNLSSLQSWGCPGERFEISGDGCFVVVDNVVHVTYYRDLPPRRVEQRLEPGLDATTWQPNFLAPAAFNDTLWHEGFIGEVQHFAHCVLDNRRPSPDIEDGYHALRLVEAILESIESGSPVNL